MSNQRSKRPGDGGSTELWTLCDIVWAVQGCISIIYRLPTLAVREIDYALLYREVVYNLGWTFCLRRNTMSPTYRNFIWINRPTGSDIHVSDGSLCLSGIGVTLNWPEFKWLSNIKSTCKYCSIRNFATKLITKSETNN